MHKIFTLTSFFILSSIKEKFGDKKNRSFRIFQYIFISIILIAFSIFSTTTLYISLHKISLETLIIPLLLLLNFIISMFLGIFRILSRFCFANDNELLLDLPLTIKDIFISKLLSIEIELLPISSLLLPSLFTYGILSNASFLFYIYSILSIIVMPIIPILYGTIISLLITRFTLKNKFLYFLKKFNFALIFMFIILMCSAIFDPSNFIKVIASLLKDPSTYSFRFIDIIFPINILLIKALLLNNSLVSLKFIVFIFLFIFISLFSTILLCKRLYLKIMLTYKDDNGIVFINKNMDFKSSNSLLKTLVKRDFSILIKNNHFFLYTFGYFILGIFVFLSPIAILFHLGISINDFKNNTLISFYFLSFFSEVLVTINASSYTSFSREGEYFYLLKQMPIPKNTLLNSKILTAFLVNTVVIVLDLVILIALAPKFYIFITLLLSQLSIIAFYVVSSIYSDAKNPNFNWTDEKNLMQNSFLKLLKPAGFFYLFTFFFFIMYFMQKSLKIPESYGLLIICFATIAINIVLTLIYYKKTLNKLYTLYNC